MSKQRVERKVARRRSTADSKEMAKESKRLLRKSLAEGMARCIYNDGMTRHLRIGDVVYVREIPNMRGHCVVLRNRKPPLVGYHLDRFELLAEEK